MLLMQEDLRTLAKGCLCDAPNKQSTDHELENDLKTIVKFCDAYYQLMQDKRSVLIIMYITVTIPYFCSLKNFFGLRDFIHFINYIRRKRLQENYGSVTPELVLKSLERNFNGNKKFEHICSLFLNKVSSIIV